MLFFLIGFRGSILIKVIEMRKREDFQGAVAPFFDKIRSFDPKLHGRLSEFVANSYLSCLANKSEYVDYSFIPEGVDPAKIKLKEDMLIASHAFKIAVGELPDCSDTDMAEIYDVLHNIGKRRGWSGLDFDKSCLNLMGVDVFKTKPPAYLPGVQSGKDYN